MLTIQVPKNAAINKHAGNLFSEKRQIPPLYNAAKPLEPVEGNNNQNIGLKVSDLIAQRPRDRFISDLSAYDPLTQTWIWK